MDDAENPHSTYSVMLSQQQRSLWTRFLMMTSSNRNNFRVTGPLWGESTGDRWIPSERPVMRSLDIFFDLRLNNRDARDLRRRRTYYDVTVTTNIFSPTIHSMEVWFVNRLVLSWCMYNGISWRVQKSIETLLQVQNGIISSGFELRVCEYIEEFKGFLFNTLSCIPLKYH